MLKWLLLLSFIPVAASMELQILPQNFMLRTDDNSTIQLTFTSNVTGLQDVFLTCADESICTVSPRFLTADFSAENRHTVQFNATVHGVFLGITKLTVSVYERQWSDYTIKILRSDWDHTKSKIFMGVMVLFVPTITFMMGTQLKIAKILGIWRRPFAPCISLLCQFGIMPLVAYTLAKYVLYPEGAAIQLALFAAGTCPGGGKSSFWTIIYGGNLDLSISLTFAQNIFAIAAMPVWIGTLGREFSTNSVSIPFVDILEALAFLLVPTTAGMIFIHYKAALYERIHGWIKKISWVMTIIMLAVGLYVNFYIVYLITWRIILCGCLLPWSGYIIAFIVGTIFRMELRDKITISIETGLQHVSIAMVILFVTFPEPEVDLALVVLFVHVMMTDKPLLIGYGCMLLYRKFTSKPAEDLENEKKVPIKETFTEITLADKAQDKPLATIYGSNVTLTNERINTIF
ncbi:unnamed protein product, partial [Mesorhabditis spiculigera]